MRKFILLLASVLVMSLGMKASGSGVWRTAITLKNGTQEIYPDSVVQRFDFVPAPDGRHRALSVRWRGDSVARVIPIDSIAEINYGEMTPYEHFAGDWYLVASPNGVANEVGLMIATVVSIPYHAVLPAPGTPDYGKYIYCHVDSLPHRKGLKYAADFKLRYDFDEASQRGNISIVLDDQLPFSEVPYTGGPETYAYADATHTYYYGVSSEHEGGDTGNRHMYFVSFNIEKQILEGMELSAAWAPADQQDLEHQYLFPKNYQIYWIVALDVPYSYVEHDEVGVVDMFASARLMRRPWTKSLKEE